MYRPGRNKEITVYEVLHNIDGPGPAADGTDVRRFRSKAAAENFAAGRHVWSAPAQPQPTTLTPHTCYSVAGLDYQLPREDWRAVLTALRERHPAIPLAVVKDGSTSIRPIPTEPDERTKVEPCADFVIRSEATADYPHTIRIEWYTEPAPGVVLRIDVNAGAMTGADTWHPLCSRVRYTLDNAPRSERAARQHPEDRRWSASWTWGAGSRSIKWWTSPGNRAPMTWTWLPGVTLDHAIGEDK